MVSLFFFFILFFFASTRRFDQLRLQARVVSGFGMVLRLQYTSKSSDFVKDILEKSTCQAIRIYDLFQIAFERLPARPGLQNEAKGIPKASQEPWFESPCTFWTPRGATMTPRGATMTLKKSCRTDSSLIFKDVKSFFVRFYVTFGMPLCCPEFKFSYLRTCKSHSTVNTSWHKYIVQFTSSTNPQPRMRRLNTFQRSAIDEPIWNSLRFDVRLLKGEIRRPDTNAHIMWKAKHITLAQNVLL